MSDQATTLWMAIEILQDKTPDSADRKDAIRFLRLIANEQEEK